MTSNLDMELVGALLGGESHSRALAKRLEASSSTVALKLKALVGANVLDFRVEGRNKVYFLKKSREARSYAIMAELYKLNKTLDRYPELRGVVESIQRNEKIGLAILFGSYAKGTATKESDMDVFIETTDKRLKQEAELLNSRLSVKIGEYDRSSPLIREIEKNHVMIKGAELYYEKSGLFQ